MTDESADRAVKVGDLLAEPFLAGLDRSVAEHLLEGRFMTTIPLFSAVDLAPDTPLPEVGNIACRD
ncbi:hypothetical protein OHA59_30650 [Streptomyces sp. NBC_01589]|uniref:hypothetical protein n=1 Tax=Streptomyces sp. NBC_01589 TaxID=2975886 RepID=UPI00386D89D1